MVDYDHELWQFWWLFHEYWVHITKSLNVRNILMTSMYFYELVLLFFIFHHNFWNGHVVSFFKGYVTRNSFFRNNFLNHDSFINYDVKMFGILHTNILSPSDRFYPFSFYFCKYSFFIYSVFDNVCYVNNILIFLITICT